MNSLQTLSIAVRKTTGRQPIILIDEYDVPIHDAHEKGYYEEALGFEKTWLSAGLKDNAQLQFAVVTGVLRIAKESIFSDLNNLKVYSLTSDTYGEFFGFTGEEVRELTEYYGVPERMEEIQDWYDGYRIGNQEIYNPWSVINYFADGCQAHAFWSQTSRNSILRSMLQKADPSALYILLVMTGYLKIERIIRTLSTSCVCEVRIPNREIRTLYADEILDSCRDILPLSISNRFEDALLGNDSENDEEY